MRITNNITNNIALQSQLRSSQKLNDATQVASTGERVNAPSDDPVAWSAAVSHDARIKRMERRTQTGERAAGDFDLAENVLASAGDIGGSEAVLDDLLFLRPDRDASTYARAVLALREGRLEEFDRITFAWERVDGPSLDLRRLQAQAWLDLDDPIATIDTLANAKRMRNGQQVRHLRAEAHRRIGYAEEAALYLEDRPQSVLEGIDSDAVRVRTHADLGQFTEAHALLAEHEGERGPELAASAWYLAKVEGREAELPGLAAAYERVRQSPLRDLAQLVPITRR
jgi:hypothetical protein